VLSDNTIISLRARNIPTKTLQKTRVPWKDFEKKDIFFFFFTTFSDRELLDTVIALESDKKKQLFNHYCMRYSSNKNKEEIFCKSTISKNV
jgi:hypothetical protein